MPKLKPVPKTKPMPERRPQLLKSPSVDEIIGGGFSKDRSTQVCGGAGCGKTLLAMEFLGWGATEFNESGAFMAFEKAVQYLTRNVDSLGFDLKDMVARKKLVLNYLHVERSEIEESGKYDLESVFIRPGSAIAANGAQHFVLDSIKSLTPIKIDAAIKYGQSRRSNSNAGRTHPESDL